LQYYKNTADNQKERISVFEQELEFYNKNKPEYLKHHLNQFVVIREQEFLGAFSTSELAYTAGISHFGNVPMLIKHVIPVDDTASIPAYSFGLLTA
jgi:epoxyqueuosine reductase QueG